MDPEQATQATQNTQGVVDPRRMGQNNSGLSDGDISDIICILHPCSPAAFRIVAYTAERTPHNVLQNDGFQNFNDGFTQSELEEQETFIISGDTPHQAMDLALRFSTRTRNPALGFLFGRNPAACDIVFTTDTCKRVSNMHFCIYMNQSGVLMLQDMSTNGTMVDDTLLRGKLADSVHKRMLNPGSIIQILSPMQNDIVKFIVRQPSREGHMEDYQSKFQAYIRRMLTAELRAKENEIHERYPEPVEMKTQSLKTPFVSNQWGMHWGGGDKYNVVGLIGKGAFATVFQLATKSEGQLFAAKELEKRRFMKNGILDRKLDNEMQIMKAISHPNIVQYVDYQDHTNHMYIIMEFVPCGDLAQLLTTPEPRPLAEHLAKAMAAQILDALAYLHRKKITHRDIKPDNILLANLDPANFTVKLSDFGLSKVVPDNDTFLKTFCGTLLYCAPEVFPHYDAHVAGKGKKRARKSNLPTSKFHSYSQTVDIWSFGAVLWYSLCVKPPFEGVADNTGRGMFDKIMMTPLDPTDLIKQGVSDDAISLLVEMLNTDPASRPTPAHCLAHRWFGTASQALDGAADTRLVPIAEEEELVEGEDPDLAGLSLSERQDPHDSQLDEVSIHSGSLEFLDPRHSKRFKSEKYAYREQGDAVDSSPELFYQSIPIVHQPDVAPGPASRNQTQPPPPKLFGEISMSALNDPARLRRGVSNAVAMAQWSQDAQPHSGSTTQVAPEGEEEDIDGNGPIASPSLLGAESMVRELNMGSPESAESQVCQRPEPMTPDEDDPVSGRRQFSVPSVHDNEVTPKPPQKPRFDRQINIPIPASFFFEPDDPSTHTPEYASKVSGHDYTVNSDYHVGDTSLPATTSGSITDRDNDGEDDLDNTDGPAEEPSSPSLPLSQFVKPPPRLGRLVSTPDSFAPITLNLSTQISIWGRTPSNTHVYSDKHDTRVPKRGIIIWFYAKGIARFPEEDQEWMKLPDLHCVICTESSQGIFVNGVMLKKGEPGKLAFGRIYSGDEVVVCQRGHDGKPGLKFVCEFFHGEAKNARPEGAPRFVVETESTRSRGKGKEREKENVAVGEKIVAA